MKQMRGSDKIGQKLADKESRREGQRKQDKVRLRREKSETKENRKQIKK